MSKQNIKNASIAAVIAVLAGIVLIGVNQVFGVTTPSQEPATSTSVSPTFSGLNLEGELKNNGATGGGAVVINDDIKVTGAFTLDGTLKNNKTLSNGTPLPVYIEDILNVMNQLWVKNHAIIGTDTNGGLLTIKSKSYVTGLNTTTGEASTSGLKFDGTAGKIWFDPSDSFGNDMPVRIDDKLEVFKDVVVKTKIKNDVDDLLLDNNVKINGSITNTTNTPLKISDAEGLDVNKLKSSDLGKITVDAALDVNNTGKFSDLEIYNPSKSIDFFAGQVSYSATTAQTNTLAGIDVIQTKVGSYLIHPIKDSIWLNANDGVAISSIEDVTSSGDAGLRIGNVNSTSTDKWMALDQNELATYGDNLYINKDTNTNVNLGDSSHNSNLTVNGNITAKKIGKFYYKDSGWLEFNDVNWKEHTASVTCNGNDIAVACWVEDWASDKDNVNFKDLDFFGGTCKSNFDSKNTSGGSTAWVKVSVSCWDTETN